MRRGEGDKQEHLKEMSLLMVLITIRHQGIKSSEAATSSCAT